FLLVAASYAIARGVSIAWAALSASWAWAPMARLMRRAPERSPERRPDETVDWRLDRRRLASWGLILAGVGVGLWMVLWALPLLTVQESLRANEPASIATGGRDTPFFVEGWSAPIVDGNVTTRIATGRRAVVRIPLPRAQAYGLTMRLDPYPRPS